MDPLLAEARVVLALEATKNNKKLSIRATAKIYRYDVPRTTLADPCASRPARRDILPNSLKLVELEKDAIIHRGKAKLAKAGNREWATASQGVNAQGWTVPRFIILAVQYHLANCTESDLLADWDITATEMAGMPTK
ncbi:hypothetical protein MRS44_017596 [Fusarium solani]|uniref:uncharacterized protein n=1 Tax=Fusarium solani TaxID=169388 RepID=UPI0032C479D7|nr:hypothetical protein MRS44_017596 [Fusarium solani]